MRNLVQEGFEDGWESAWHGKLHYAHKTGSSTQGHAGLRLLYKKDSHYGFSMKKDVTPSRHVRMAFKVKANPSWNSDSTGKTLGFADLRWKNSKGQSYAHGNRAPGPDGFSFRTWYGHTKNGELPIGMYIYHNNQKRNWGDSIPVGSIKIGGDFVLFEVEANFDEGYCRARVGGGEWVSHNIKVGENTQVVTAWLDAYYGGAAVAPKDMSMDIDEYCLLDLSPQPAEDTGPEAPAPEIDWDEIRRRVEAQKAAEEAAKVKAEETEEFSCGCGCSAIINDLVARVEALEKA